MIANALLAELLDSASDPEQRATAGEELAVLLSQPALRRRGAAHADARDAIATSPILLDALAGVLTVRAPSLLPVAEVAARVVLCLVEPSAEADRPSALRRRALLAAAGLGNALAAHSGSGPETVDSLRTTAARALALVCAAPAARALVANSPPVLRAVAAEVLHARAGGGPASAHGVRAAYELSLSHAAAVMMDAHGVLVPALVALSASERSGAHLRLRAALALANVARGREPQSLAPLPRAALLGGALGGALPPLLADAVGGGQHEGARWDVAGLLHTARLLAASRDGLELLLGGQLRSGDHAGGAVTVVRATGCEHGDIDAAADGVGSSLLARAHTPRRPSRVGVSLPRSVTAAAGVRRGTSPARRLPSASALLKGGEARSAAAARAARARLASSRALDEADARARLDVLAAALARAVESHEGSSATSAVDCIAALAFDERAREMLGRNGAILGALRRAARGTAPAHMQRAESAGAVPAPSCTERRGAGATRRGRGRRGCGWQARRRARGCAVASHAPVCQAARRSARASLRRLLAAYGRGRGRSRGARAP